MKRILLFFLITCMPIQVKPIEKSWQNLGIGLAAAAIVGGTMYYFKNYLFSHLFSFMPKKGIKPALPGDDAVTVQQDFPQTTIDELQLNENVGVKQYPVLKQEGEGDCAFHAVKNLIKYAAINSGQATLDSLLRGDDLIASWKDLSNPGTWPTEWLRDDEIYKLAQTLRPAYTFPLFFCFSTIYELNRDILMEDVQDNLAQMTHPGKNFAYGIILNTSDGVAAGHWFAVYCVNNYGKREYIVLDSKNESRIFTPLFKQFITLVEGEAVSNCIKASSEQLARLKIKIDKLLLTPITKLARLQKIAQLIEEFEQKGGPARVIAWMRNELKTRSGAV